MNQMSLRKFQTLLFTSSCMDSSLKIQAVFIYIIYQQNQNWIELTYHSYSNAYILAPIDTIYSGHFPSRLL